MVDYFLKVKAAQADQQFDLMAMAQGPVGCMAAAAGGGTLIPDGTDQFQLCYWDGAAWVPVPAGATVLANGIAAPTSYGGGILDLFADSTTTLYAPNVVVQQLGSSVGGFTVTVDDGAKVALATTLIGGSGGDPAIGFLGAAPVVRQSITGASTAAWADSIIQALVALGLVSDDR